MTRRVLAELGTLTLVALFLAGPVFAVWRGAGGW